MTDIKKIRRTAFVLFAAVSVVLLWFIIDSARGIFVNVTEWNVASVVTTSIGTLIVLATLIIALIMLHSTKADETPFNIKNVKRLKAIAVLLIAFEPYLLIQQWVFNRFYPIVLADNMSIKVHLSLGGVVLAAGLVVYCISLVFKYGISLQQQVDETL